MKFCWVKKAATKAKEISLKVVQAISDANKRRAERLMSHELQYYYRREYRNDFLEKFPYHAVTRRD
jgi:hypothetical protein